MAIIYSRATMLAACIGAGQTLEAVQEFPSGEPEISKGARTALETLEHKPDFSRM